MKKRILIVDDSEVVLAMATEALEEGGFEVVTAMDIKGAVPLIHAERKPDLIILDVMLPDLDGDKKAKKLKDDERTRSIPILLLSSKTEEELRWLVKSSGADGFIRKPFGHRQLVEQVESAFCACGEA